MSNAFVVAGSSIIAGRGQGWHDGPLPNPHHWKTPDWKTAMMLPDARLIVFDKDGVLLDLNQTWMPLVVSLAEHLTMRAEGCVERDDLLAAHNAGYGGFVAIADGAPELPGFIPSADLVLAEIDGLAQRLKGS